MNSSIVRTNRLVAENGLYLPTPGTGGGGGVLTGGTQTVGTPGGSLQPGQIDPSTGTTYIGPDHAAGRSGFCDSGTSRSLFVSTSWSSNANVA